MTLLKQMTPADLVCFLTHFSLAKKGPQDHCGVPGDRFRGAEAVPGGRPRELFESFDATPLGSASVAQVHRATLVPGTLPSTPSRLKHRTLAPSPDVPARDVDTQSIFGCSSKKQEGCLCVAQGRGRENANAVLFSLLHFSFPPSKITPLSSAPQSSRIRATYSPLVVCAPGYPLLPRRVPAGGRGVPPAGGEVVAVKVQRPNIEPKMMGARGAFGWTSPFGGPPSLHSGPGYDGPPFSCKLLSASTTLQTSAL